MKPKNPSIIMPPRNVSLSIIIETHKKILAPSESNYEVDLISYYKKLIAL